MLFCSYDPTWKDEAAKRGIWRIDDGVEAMGKIAQEKNIALFERQKVMNTAELKARELVFYGHYTGVVEMEALCLIDMLVQQVSSCKPVQSSDMQSKY
jgi:glutamine synthetase